MGAILAILSDEGESSLGDTLRTMAARSPWRGRLIEVAGPGVALGAVSRVENPDAWLGQSARFLVAYHGYVGNVDALEGVHGGCSDRPSPAEVVAWGLEHEGENFFDRLRGEFVIGAYDRHDRSLLVFRSLLGTLPAFFCRDGARLLVAAEPRQLISGADLRETLEEDVLIDHLLGLAVCVEPTMFNQVFRIVPGTRYRFMVEPQHGTEISIDRLRRWSAPGENPRWSERDLPELTLRLRDALHLAVARARPSTPYALALSGGLDSSTIWGILNTSRGPSSTDRALALSLVYPGLPCDESESIDEILRSHPGSNEKIVAVPSQFLDRLPQVLSAVDTVPGLTLYHDALLAPVLSQHGCPTLLTGAAGDEWLSGRTSSLQDELLSGHLFRFLRALFTFDIPPTGSRRRFAGYHLRRSAIRLLGRSTGWTPPSWLHPSRHEIACALVDQRNSTEASECRGRAARAYRLRCLRTHQAGRYFEPMEQFAGSVGVSLRHPFSDPDLIALSFEIPERLFLVSRDSRRLHRMAVEGLVPDGVRLRLRKPTFETVFQDEARQLVSSERVREWALCQRNLADAEGLDKLRRAGRESLSKAIRFMNLYAVERLIRRFA